MNPEFKAKWVAALRSGKYEQAQRYLRIDDRYCCLGVACDISGVGRWGKNGYYTYDATTVREFLPARVAGLAGLSKKTEGMLAKMNDHGASFATIADWIEGHL